MKSSFCIVFIEIIKVQIEKFGKIVKKKRVQFALGRSETLKKFSK